MLLVTQGAPNAEEVLPGALDRLALAATARRFPFPSAVRDNSETAREPYDVWRARAVAAFPGFGYYNATQPVSEKVGEGELVVGDAIDDLADIAADLDHVLHLWPRSPELALWEFQESFAAHWGLHLRSLQLYLQSRPWGW